MSDDTLVAIFWDRVARYRDRVAQKVKRDGKWVDISWRQYGEIVREIALGLLALELQKGEAVALLSQSRGEWVQCDFGILSAGCITIPIYPSYPPDQIVYIVNDSEAKVLIVENQVQLDKVRQVLGKMERLERIILMDGDPGGDPFVLSLERLRALGLEKSTELAPRLEELKDTVHPEDIATIVYTSGTTGPPKGVMQTHGNHAAMLRSVSQRTDVGENDTHLLFLPLAHTFARLESYVGVHLGLITAFAEHIDKLAENLREVSPTFIYSVPRVFEKVYARLQAQVQAAPPLRQKIFRWALGVGRQVSERQQAARLIPPGLRLKHFVANRLVFHKIHQALGGRLRFCVSGGAPLSREIAEFFHAVGILILEGYGLTECCPVLTGNTLDGFKFGTVGRAVPGVELRIAPDGEILARGPNIAKGYFKKPEATAEVFDSDGWFHTGDVGVIDPDGFLTITDRKKDLMVTAGGINVAPQNVENALKTHPFISQAMVYGDKRPYPVALIALNPEESAGWAKEHGLDPEDPTALARHEETRKLVARIIEEKNAILPSYAQVKKFAIVPGDFTQDGGELTPTLKVKRKVVAEKYRDLIESLYAS